MHLISQVQLTLPITLQIFIGEKKNQQTTSYSFGVQSILTSLRRGIKFLKE